MKVVILAGGLGTRSPKKPKFDPNRWLKLVVIPFCGHIMRHYAFYNHNEFFVALVTRGGHSPYFLDYHYMSHESLTLNWELAKSKCRAVMLAENWIVHLPNTGQLTNMVACKRLQPGYTMKPS